MDKRIEQKEKTKIPTVKLDAAEWDKLQKVLIEGNRVTFEIEKNAEGRNAVINLKVIKEK